MFDIISQIPQDKLPLLIALLALPILPNLLAIWHIFRNDFPTPQEKMAWIGGAVFLPVLGGVAYFLFGRKRVTRS